MQKSNTELINEFITNYIKNNDKILDINEFTENILKITTYSGYDNDFIKKHIKFANNIEYNMTADYLFDLGLFKSNKEVKEYIINNSGKEVINDHFIIIDNSIYFKFNLFKFIVKELTKDTTHDYSFKVIDGIIMPYYNHYRSVHSLEIKNISIAGS